MRRKGKGLAPRKAKINIKITFLLIEKVASGF